MAACPVRAAGSDSMGGRPPPAVWTRPRGPLSAAAPAGSPAETPPPQTLMHLLQMCPWVMGSQTLRAPLADEELLEQQPTLSATGNASRAGGPPLRSPPWADPARCPQGWCLEGLSVQPPSGEVAHPTRHSQPRRLRAEVVHHIVRTSAAPSSAALSQCEPLSPPSAPSLRHLTCSNGLSFSRRLESRYVVL